MSVTLPYLPPGRTIRYVSEDNRYMRAARLEALRFSKDPEHPTGAVVVKKERIIGRGANGSDYHIKHGCERARLGVKTGEKYELCDGCHPRNHCEAKALEDARRAVKDTTGADLYLWGHWWCCKLCWDAMREAHIRDIYLLKGSREIFNRRHQQDN